MPAFIPAASTTAFRGSRVQPAVCRLQPRQTHAVPHRITMALDALLFDCDGVLADTERDAHRVAFNLAFKERGLSDVWDEALYGKLLETGGGKERMTAYWNGEPSWPDEVGDDADAREEMVKELHALKTALFMELVDSGKVPLRPGVARLVGEARAAGVPIAVCSTSNEKAVQRIVDQLGDASEGIQVFAGDVVPKKKPSPDIYLLAAEKLRVDPKKVCVVEDSFIGLAAARAAGMPCVVTKSTYTVDEDFQQAQKIVNSLEDPVTTLDDLNQLAEGMADEKPAGGRGRVIRARRRFGSSYL